MLPPRFVHPEIARVRAQPRSPTPRALGVPRIRSLSRLWTVSDEITRVRGHDRRGGGIDPLAALGVQLVDERLIDRGRRGAVPGRPGCGRGGQLAYERVRH